MGFLNFFFRPPSQHAFARLLMAELRRAGAVGPITYDAAFGRIVVGEGAQANQIFLENFYQEYVSLPRRQRRQHLADRARMLTRRDFQFPEDFDEARSHLRPKLWVRGALEKTRLRIQLDGDDPSKFDIPEYDVGSHLVASLVYDLPDQMMSVGRKELEKWGVTYYEALEAGRDNLEREPSEFAQLGDGFFAAATGDSYDACRLLLPSVMEQFQVVGELIAMAPNRDALLVTGSDDDQGLELMLDLTAEALKDPRPMVPIPLKHEDGQWVDWQPPVDHPLAGRFRELAIRFLGGEYADQKELLEELDEKQGNERFIASYSGLTQPDGQLSSYAVWTRGVPTLLPEVDRLFLLREPHGPPVEMSWGQARHLLGHYFRATDFYPPRFMAADFPSDEELARLERRGPTA